MSLVQKFSLDDRTSNRIGLCLLHRAVSCPKTTKEGHRVQDKSQADRDPYAASSWLIDS